MTPAQTAPPRNRIATHKSPQKPRRNAWRGAILSAATIPLIHALPAGAQLYWDINGNASGAGGATPAGTWDGATGNWNTIGDGTGATTVWSPGSTAVFSAGGDATGAFTITLSGTQSAAGITVEEGSLTFTGSELDLSSQASVSVAGSTTTINSVIGGIASLIKSGAGTLVLAGNNTVSGPVIINAGTVSATSANALANVTSLTVNNGGTLALAGSGALNSAANVNLNNGTFNAYGATMVLSGATQQINSLTLTGGQVDLNNGTLAVTSAITSNAAGTGVTLASTIGTGNGTLDIGSNNVFFQVGSGAATTTDISINADLAGNGVLTRQGANNGTGVLALTKSNAGFTGTYTQQGGRLLLNGANSALSAVSTINLKAGTLDINNAAVNHSNRINDGAAINMGDATITLVPNGAPTTESLGGMNFTPGNSVLSIGTMSTGDTTLTLGSTNRQVGSTVVYTTDQLASSTLGVQTSGVTPKISLNGQADGYVGGGHIIATTEGHDLAVYDTTLGSVRAPNSSEYSTSLADNTYVRFAPTSHSFTGSHTLQALTISPTGVSTINMGATTISTGMVIKASGANIATIACSTNTWKSGTNNEMIFDIAAGSLNFGGRFTNSGGQVTKTGAGTLHFYLTDPLIPNNGTLMVNQGTFLLNSATSMSTVGTIVVNRGTVSIGANVAVNNNKINDNAWITLNGATGGQSVFIMGTNTNSNEHIGTVQMQGGGVFTGITANGTVTFDQWIIRDGSVGAGSAQLTVPNVELNNTQLHLEVGHNPAAPVDMVVTGVLRNGGIAKFGVGTLQLNGTASTFAGGVAINDGVLRIGNDLVLGDPANSVSFAGGTLNTSANLTLVATRPMVFNGAGNIDVAGGTTATSSASFSGTGALVKTGQGTLTLTANNTHAGGTQMADGQVIFNNSNAAAAGSISVSTTGGGTTTFSVRTTGITLANDVALSPGAGTIDFVVTSGNAGTLTGVISGNSGLVKGLGGGAGTLTLANAANSFTGNVVIMGGTLNVASDGALGNVNNDIAIGGGTIANSVLQATTDVTLASTRDISLNSVNIGSCMINVGTLATLSIPGKITGSGSLQKNGTGSLILGGSNSYTGGTSASNGMLIISNDNNLGAPAGSVTFGAGTLVTTASINSIRPLLITGSGTFDTQGNTAVFANTATGVGSFRKLGTGTLRLDAVRVGTLNVDAGTVAISNARDALLKSSKTSTLNVLAGAALDLNSNDLVLDYNNLATPGTPDPARLAAVQDLVSAGFAGGAWTGKGITSTAAKLVAADGANFHKTALGFAEASAAGYTSGTYDGFTVDGDMILVRYTYTGDANLDGMVNGLDFNAVANSFGNSSQTWVSGDFNFDGVVNGLDFNSIATNFGFALPSAPAFSGLPGATALGALVPEPATIGMLLAFPLVARKRSRRS